ncbi:MAG: hypothetical protein WC100_00835 [Sterolibacterium sp.]
MIISPNPKQLTLQLEPDLTTRFRNVRDVIAAGVYQRGLKRVAGDLDMAPGNLSCALNDEGTRHVSVDMMERYIQTQGDLTPIHYLIARYMGDMSEVEAATMQRVETLLAEVAALVGQTPQKKSRAR